MEKSEDLKEKMMELNYDDKDDNPRYGWDVYVQRISCYIQQRKLCNDQDIENPYREVKNQSDTHRYVPDLHSLGNGNTMIIIENSQSGSIEDTLITARQQWESRWRRLPFYLAYESHVSNDDRMALEYIRSFCKTCGRVLPRIGRPLSMLPTLTCPFSRTRSTST